MNHLSRRTFFLLPAILALLVSARSMGAATNAPSAKIATPVLSATNAAPAAPAATETPVKAKDDDDDDDGPNIHIKIHPDHPGASNPVSDVLESMIPICGIVFSFGMPVMIVFVIAYFRFRSRRENLATIREYLARGIPVPPELLQGSTYNAPRGLGGSLAFSAYDLRRGIRITAVGLALTLAFYTFNPHAHMWCWGLIPLVIGLGYVVLGLIERREEAKRGVPPLGTTQVPPL